MDCIVQIFSRIYFKIILSKRVAFLVKTINSFRKSEHYSNFIIILAQEKAMGDFYTTPQSKSPYSASTSSSSRSPASGIFTVIPAFTHSEVWTVDLNKRDAGMFCPLAIFQWEDIEMVFRSIHAQVIALRKRETITVVIRW